MANQSHDDVSLFKPYHALYASDGEDDSESIDWEDLPEVPSSYSSDESLNARYRNMAMKPSEYFGRSKVEESRGQSRSRMPTRPPSKIEIRGVRMNGGSKIPWKSTRPMTDEERREWEIKYAISNTRRYLTRTSQFLLKLEARAGKTTNQSIRQTLEATVRDNTYDFEAPRDKDHKDELEELAYLSKSVWTRLYLIDRTWRREYRKKHDENGSCPPLQLLSEPAVREWLKVETEDNTRASENTCFYTVADLADARGFKDWIIYLRKDGGFRDHPTDEQKLVELAWELLDRNLRGPKPVNPTKVEDFILSLEKRHKRGAFAEALKDPKKQEREYDEAWKSMRKTWGAGTSY